MYHTLSNISHDPDNRQNDNCEIILSNHFSTFQQFGFPFLIQPENILCLGGGKPGYEEIKLIDFGMTRVLKDGEDEKVMGGTPEFIGKRLLHLMPIHQFI